MISDRKTDMQTLLGPCGGEFTASDMRSKVAETGIYDYTERAIGKYLDGLVQGNKLISQNVKMGKYGRERYYSKDTDRESHEINAGKCGAGNIIIFPDICRKHCKRINCEAYYETHRKKSKTV